MKLPYPIQQLYLVMLSDNPQITQLDNMIEVRTKEGLYIFTIYNNRLGCSKIQAKAARAYQELKETT